MLASEASELPSLFNVTHMCSYMDVTHEGLPAVLLMSTVADPENLKPPKTKEF